MCVKEYSLRVGLPQRIWGLCRLLVLQAGYLRWRDTEDRATSTPLLMRMVMPMPLVCTQSNGFGGNFKAVESNCRDAVVTRVEIGKAKM